MVSSRSAGVSNHERPPFLNFHRLTHPEFAVEYPKQAMEGMNDPEGRGAALLALRQIAEFCGGVAKAAGVQRESLYRALSPKGNPTLNTLLAVLNPSACGSRSSRIARHTPDPLPEAGLAAAAAACYASPLYASRVAAWFRIT